MTAEGLEPPTYRSGVCRSTFELYSLITRTAVWLAISRCMNPCSGSWRFKSAGMWGKSKMAQLEKIDENLFKKAEGQHLAFPFAAPELFDFFDLCQELRSVILKIVEI